MRNWGGDTKKMIRVIDPPGPRGLPFVGVGPQFRADPLRLLQRVVGEYGDMVRLRLLNIPLTPMEPKHQLFLVNHPTLVRDICVTHAQKYRTYQQLVERLKRNLQLGDGELLTSDGQAWAQRKRLLQPSFQKHHLEGMADRLLAPVVARVERWKALPDGTVIDVDQEMTQLVTHMFASLFLGTDLDHEDMAFGQDLTDMLAGFSRRMALPLQFLLKTPSKRNRAFERSLKAVEGRLYEIFHRERDRGACHGALLGKWIEKAQQKSNQPLSDRDLRDQVMLLLLAGRKNVANALSWSFHLLGQHPQVAQKLRHEVDSTLRGQPPTPQDLRKAPYVKMVQQAALRLYPTAWLIARTCLEDDTVGGYHIPKGATVFMSPYLLHRHPSYWDEPDAFDPEDFADRAEGNAANHRSPSYLPFGVGPRICIGKFLTEFQMQLVLTMVSQHFVLEPKPGHTVRIKATSSLHLGTGLPMRLRKRQVRFST